LKTNVYVDAFNLYYGCLKKTPYRWLDLRALAQALLPKHTVHRIRYFTATVSAIPGDGDGLQPQRQQAYLRALGTIPNLTIHLGHYLQGVRSMPLANPPAHGSKFADVIKMEEKGSDVNLATMLLVDAFDGDFEQAVIISNDSDLVLPVDVVKSKFKRPVGVVYPCTRPNRTPSVALQKVATFTREIREPTLRASQFASPLTDADGTFTKPAKW
jgi:hypothetical protein